MLICLAKAPTVNNGRNEIRRGSMGYVYKLANLLVKTKDRSDYIRNFLDNFPAWKDFEEMELMQ